MDADVRHPGLQHQERERAEHHLRQLRVEWEPVWSRDHGQRAGGPAPGQDQAGPEQRGGEQRGVSGEWTR